MRYLSKIYFINSAHVPYAEVHLDGNVHFIGTQGVGKSTLLRAILFFYNADKEKLGIRRQGQRNFDDFYLPTTSSYIVYQVNRDDERPFSIITFRNAGRAAFRFVDAPFDPKWIIDDDGVISSDHSTIRQHILKDGIDSSRIIDNYGAYRDIIYGNNHASLTKDLRKYALLESPKYHNIPRIIQNVFLNERVDADFIKETIIKSLSEDAEPKIPLRDFHSKLADFDQDYADIMLWSKLDKKGNKETVQKAEAMIDISHGIKLKESLLLEHAGFLAFAMEKTCDSLPIWRQQLETTRQNIAGKSQALADLERDYENERSRLDRELGAMNLLIKECRALRDKYEKSKIDDIINLDRQEGSLLKQQKRVGEQIMQLKSQYLDITQRYNTLIETALLAHQEFKQGQMQHQIQNRKDYNMILEKLIAFRDQGREDVNNQFSDRINENQKAIDQTIESINQMRLLLVKEMHSKPFSEEIEKWKETIKDTEDAISKEDLIVRESEMRINVTIREGELELIKVDDEFRPQFSQLEKQKETLLERIENENALLSRTEGSLCQWLEANKPNWRSNIGKVASEDNVLYNSTLCPAIVGDETSSFFGVELDLSSLESSSRTPQEISKNLESLNSQLHLLLKDIESLQQRKDKRTQELKNARGHRIKALRDEKFQATQRKAVAEQNLKLAMLQIDDWTQRQKEEIEAQVNKINSNMEELQVVLEMQRENLAKTRGELTKCLDKISHQYQTQKRAEEKRLNAMNSEIDVLIKNHKASTDDKIAEYKAAQNNEIAQAGADTKLIQGLEKELENLEFSLLKISENKPLIYNYQKDKAEKLDQEGSFRKKKTKIEASILSLGGRRQKQKAKLMATIEKLKAIDVELNGKIEKGWKGLKEAEGFKSSETFQEEWRKIHPMRSALDCSEIISAMHTFISEKYEAEKKLQQTVIDFQHPFSQRNIFKFPTQLETIDDYQTYVDSVEDFVVNNKIEQFQQLTSNVYSGIISQISYEFGNIITQESSIKKIINEVKYDFSQKTFAGVIRALDLELRRSDDPLINTLQRIHDFNEEHQFEMGQNNLFSLDENQQVNRQAVAHLHRLMEELNKHPEKDALLLSDIFSLRFKIDENDNSTGWQENIKMVGSDGTDILVKAILNILLINVFKKRATKKSSDFQIHCMMDEIGKLADENIQGILDFANARNIYIVNSSPKSHRPLSYRHLYLLTKDADANTIVHQILSTRQSVLNESQNNS